MARQEERWFPGGEERLPHSPDDDFASDGCAFPVAMAVRPLVTVVVAESRRRDSLAVTEEGDRSLVAIIAFL